MQWCGMEVEVEMFVLMSEVSCGPMKWLEMQGVMGRDRQVKLRCRLSVAQIECRELASSQLTDADPRSTCELGNWIQEVGSSSAE